MDEARIVVEKSRDGYEVISASLWRGDIDYTGILEGMIGEVYRNRLEMREAVRELVGTNKVRLKLFVMGE